MASRRLLSSIRSSLSRSSLGSQVTISNTRFSSSDVYSCSSFINTRIFPQTVALSRIESNNGLASIPGDSRPSLFQQAAAFAPHFPCRFMSTQINSVESSQDSSTPVSEVPPRIKFKRLDKTSKHIMQIRKQYRKSEHRGRYQIYNQVTLCNSKWKFLRTSAVFQL